MCDELRLLRDWPEGEPAEIDLRDFDGRRPETLAVLLASLRGLHRRQVCNPLENFQAPAGDRPVTCLSPEALRGLIAESAGHWQYEGEGEMIRGCEAFASGEGVARVTSSLIRQLQSHSTWSDASLRALGSVIFELAENVVQHSQAEGGVIVVEIRPDDEAVTIAVADCGIGMRRSLTCNPKYADISDDLTAIVTAMGPGVTGEAGTGGGMGLYLARMIVRTNEATFRVRSGGACREESMRVNDSSNLPHLHGTLITVEARTDLAFDYGAVESSLRRPEGIAERR